MVDRTEADTALEVALAVSGRENFDAASPGNFAIVPDGYHVASLEEYQIAPNRCVADHKFVSATSLAAYVNRFAGPGLMLSADAGKAQISAVIDGDTPASPGFKRHRATYVADMSDSLKAWLSICGRQLSQVEFGQFLEDRAVDVVVPDAATIMEMVMTFDATKRVTFKSAVRLHDGARQFQYVEENEARGGLTLPDHFMVNAAIYQGMPATRLKFMLRYRIDDGKLLFTVVMHDKATVLRLAFEQTAETFMAAVVGDAPLFWGG